MNFKYSKIIAAFDNYIDENYDETVYLDSLILSREYTSERGVSFRSSSIKNNNFETGSFLDKIDTKKFSSLIRSQHKINKYIDHSFHLLNSISPESRLDIKLGTMQSSLVNLHFNRSDYLVEFKKTKKRTPESIHIMMNNVGMITDKDPYESLSKLMDSFDQSKRNETFYYSFIRYYFNAYDISSFFRLLYRNKSNNTMAFTTAVLYTFARNNFERKTFNHFATVSIEREMMSNLWKSLPTELNNKFGIVDTIVEKTKYIASSST